MDPFRRGDKYATAPCEHEIEVPLMSYAAKIIVQCEDCEKKYTLEILDLQGVMTPSFEEIPMPSIFNDEPAHGTSFEGTCPHCNKSLTIELVLKGGE